MKKDCAGWRVKTCDPQPTELPVSEERHVTQRSTGDKEPDAGA